MADYKKIWAITRDALVKEMVELGFSAQLGELVAKNLRSPKAMERMRAYLSYVKPKSEELVVDEMLAICDEINAWRAKKEAREANESYNVLLYYGLGDDSLEQADS